MGDPEMFLDLVMWPNEPFSILKSSCISGWQKLTYLKTLVDWMKMSTFSFSTPGLERLKCW